MTANFWGLNIQPQKLQDRPRLIEYYHVTQAKAAVVLGDVQLARDIKAVAPGSIVMVRFYKPDGDYYKGSPEQFLKVCDDNHLDDNLWAYVDNEAGINQDWHLRLIAANLKRATPRKLVICNLSVGTPARPNTYIEDIWKENAELLRALNRYRDWLILGLHEYFNCVPTSGFIGGWPDHAGVAPGQLGGENFVPFENWPPLSRAQALTKFHCGRFEFLNRACQQLDINPPRIVLTEHGQDDVSDIKQWVEKTVGQNIRGWQTLKDWWRHTYGWEPDRVYYEMLWYLRQSVYLATNVEAACLYVYGNNGDPTWLQFNLEGSGVTERIQANSVTPIPKLPEFPATFALRAITATLSATTPKLIIRAVPAQSGDKVGLLTNEGTPGRYIPLEALKSTETVYETISGVTGAWLPCEVNGVQGWVFGGYLRVKELENLPDPTPPPMDLTTAYNLAWNIRTQADELLKILSQGKVS